MLTKYLKNRVTALQSLSTVVASIIWLSWSLVRHGHTETWNLGFLAFLTAVVTGYITSRRSKVDEIKAKGETGDAG